MQKRSKNIFSMKQALPFFRVLLSVPSSKTKQKNTSASPMQRAKT
jgi:hypothetical protein